MRRERLCDLVGESLLDLRPTRENFYGSRQFRQTDDAPVGGQVGDVHLAGEGKQMMFTNAVKLDARNGDDLIAGLGEGALKMRGVRSVDASMTTYARRGVFQSDAARSSEVMSLINTMSRRRDDGGAN